MVANSSGVNVMSKAAVAVEAGAAAAADEAPAIRPMTASYRRIWELAWPVSISTSTVTLLTLANLFWIGHLGTVAVAAVSLGGNILFIVFGIGNVVYTGALAIVSRRIGEGQTAAAARGLLHALVLGVALGLAVAGLGYVATPPLVRFFDAGVAVEQTAVGYLRIMLLGQVFLYVTLAMSGSYQAAGDARTPMAVNVAVVVINGVLDPFFIFSGHEVEVAGVPLGWLGWGVDGGAVAAVISGAVGLLLFSTLLAVRQRPFRLAHDGHWRLSAVELWRMVRIGVPASVSMVARPLSTFLLLKVIASFGTAAIAAFGIALRSFSINFIPYSGINTAMSALVGQSLGARQPREAQRIVRRGLALTTVLGVFFCVTYYAFSRAIIMAFDQEPAVLAAGEPFLKLMALSFLFSGPMFPLISAMNGAGDTQPPMITAFLANWPVKLPLAYVLAVPAGYGVNGVWIAMFVSIVLEAALTFWWYRRGTWQTKRV